MTKSSSTPEPLIRTPEPSYVEGAWFDEEAVERVVRFFRKLRHIKGRWAGSPIALEDWQIEHFIRPVFGWKHPDGRRIITTVWLEIPRKNGKTTLGTGIGLYLLSADREPGAEIYAAAAARSQARFVFDPARQMVEKSPPLRKRLEPLRNSIVYRGQASFFQVISSVARLQHGGNVHGAIIDEVHVHRTRDLIDALETGVGSRSQPLILFITTSGEEGDTSIYAEKHSYCRKVADGRVEDPTFWGVIYAAEIADDFYDPATWEKANPGIGVTVRREYLESHAKKAEAQPSYRNTFLRYHLNVRTSSTSTWMELEDWDASAGRVVRPAELEDAVCFGGLDISKTQDVASLIWDFPAELEGPGETKSIAQGHQIIGRFWLPEELLEDLDVRTDGMATRWVEDGWLTLTPGDVLDYDAIERKIIEDVETFDVAQIAYNRRGAAQLATRLTEQGLELVSVAPGIGLAAAMQEWERAVLTKVYRHADNPVLRWMVSNLVVRQNTDGDVWPDKGKSRDNITGCTGAVMALGRAILGVEPEEEEEIVTHHEPVEISPY